MKTIIVIETAAELLKFAEPTRTSGDKIPFLGSDAILVCENDMGYIHLTGVEGFELAKDISIEDIIKEMAKKCHLDVHIT